MSLTFPPPLCLSDDLQMTFFDLQSNFFLILWIIIGLMLAKNVKSKNTFFLI